MYRIICMSRTPDRLSDEKLDDILVTAAERYSEIDVTGLQLYARKSFMHVLEGPRGRVQEVFDGIFMDPMHQRVRVFQQRDVQARRFDGFAMGYRRSLPDPAPEGFFELTRSALCERIPTDAAEELGLLLKGFGEAKIVNA